MNLQEFCIAKFEEYTTEVSAAGRFADDVDATHEGKFVHLTGAAVALLGDETHSITLDQSPTILGELHNICGLRMLRPRKERSSVVVKKPSKYSYHKEWSSYLHDSSWFEKPENHQNPPAFPYQAKSWQAKDVSLGAFQLSGDLISKISGETSVSVDAAMIPQAMRERLLLKVMDTACLPNSTLMSLYPSLQMWN